MNITTINTIETSSLCDNKCEYCPAPIRHKHRKTGLMSWETFEIAIDWVLHFCRKGTQRELNLFGIGEPLLNPDIVKMVDHARNRLPFRQKIHLNTNGNNMTAEIARAFKSAGITSIDITAHKARSAAQTIRHLQNAGIDGRISLDFITQPNNWANQVDWFEPLYHKAQGMECPWLDRGQVMIMSNGDVTTCCIDAFAQGVFTNVRANIDEYTVDPHDLCDACHHIVPRKYQKIIAIGG